MKAVWMRLLPLLLLIPEARAQFSLNMDSLGQVARAHGVVNAMYTGPLSLTSGYPKNDLTVAVARLHHSVGKDSVAREYVADCFKYLNTTWGNEGDPFFIWIGMVRAYFPWRQAYTPAQTATLRAHVTGFRRWFKGDTTIYPDQTNPVVAGTENHHTMTWTSLYLFAQAFPDARWYRDDVSEVTFSSAEAMARARNLIIERGRLAYRHGNSEFLSPKYELFHWVPYVNLYDFAEDAAMKAVAEALLLYHANSLAHSQHQGHFLAPVTREYPIQSNRPDNWDISQFVPWLYWGFGSPESYSFLRGNGRFSVYLAVSAWRPPRLFDRIAKTDSAAYRVPHSVRETKAFWEAEPPRYAMRSVHRTPRYALGMGNLRTKPGYYIIDDNQFSIVWDSDDPWNSMHLYHNYWYSNSGEESTNKGRTSPFMQLTHHKDAAIVMFRFPKKDPWPEPGWNAAWLKNRDRFRDSVPQVAVVRLPAKMDERVESGPWRFFRTGQVFLGVLPFGGRLEEHVVGDHRFLKNRGQTCGFVVEVGDLETHGSFETFREKLAANSRHIDLVNLEAAYTSSAGDSLRLRYNTSLTPPDNSVPMSWVNGEPIDYAAWPAFESPFATVRNMVLKAGGGINNGISNGMSGESIEVDWTDEVPRIVRSASSASIQPGSGSARQASAPLRNRPLRWVRLAGSNGVAGWPGPNHAGSYAAYSLDGRWLGDLSLDGSGRPEGGKYPAWLEKENGVISLFPR